MSRGGKRPLKVGNRDFLWWVREDENHLHLSLYVASEDGAIFVMVPLSEVEMDAHVITLGAEFRGHTMVQGTHRRFVCPYAPLPSPVTPAHVARIAEWAALPGALPPEVDGR